VDLTDKMLRRGTVLQKES